MKQYLRSFEKKRRFPKLNIPPLKLKQKISLGVVLTAVLYNFIYAQTQHGGWNARVNVYKTVYDLIKNGQTDSSSADIMRDFVDSYLWLDFLKGALNYIISAQENSITAVANTPFANSSIFSHILSGITIFACVGCAYKIVTHFLKTEKHDNINSIFGYFSFLAPLVLFLFSNKIVDTLAGINKGVTVNSVQKIGNQLNQELDNVIIADFNNYKDKVQELEEQYEQASFTEKIPIRATIIGKSISTTVGNTIKYIFYSLVILIFTSVLAIPSFIMTFMVKILLSVMIAGAKIVFLLAFIPGFENAWKTFLLNILNILLWIPIFNAIISFIITLLAQTMGAGVLESGSIIWISVVAVVASFQAVSLTTNSANSIINGAGAGMAGAMGSLATMSGIGLTASALKGGAGLATSLIAPASTMSASNKLNKSIGGMSNQLGGMSNQLNSISNKLSK